MFIADEGVMPVRHLVLKKDDIFVQNFAPDAMAGKKPVRAAEPNQQATDLLKKNDYFVATFDKPKRARKLANYKLSSSTLGESVEETTEDKPNASPFLQQLEQACDRVELFKRAFCQKKTSSENIYLQKEYDKL